MPKPPPRICRQPNLGTSRQASASTFHHLENTQTAIYRICQKTTCTYWPYGWGRTVGVLVHVVARPPHTRFTGGQRGEWRLLTSGLSVGGMGCRHPWVVLVTRSISPQSLVLIDFLGAPVARCVALRVITRAIPEVSGSPCSSAGPNYAGGAVPGPGYLLGDCRHYYCMTLSCLPRGDGHQKLPTKMQQQRSMES